MQYLKLKKNKIISPILILLFIFISNSVPITKAETVDELQEKIEEQRIAKEKLDKEIAEQRAKLVEINKQTTTLQTTVNSLNLTEKKIGTEIQKTETGINESNYALNKLELEITDKETKILNNRDVLAKTIRDMNQSESESLIEIILFKKNFSEVFNDLRNLEAFKASVYGTVLNLQDLTSALQEDHQEKVEEKVNLESLKKELSGEKSAVAYTKQEKQQLLTVTKSTEAEYQRILKEKEAARAQIESDLNALESQLQFTLDPSKLPNKGSGVLKYPVSEPVVTQGFGLTSFALSGAYGYSNGQPNPHRGVDFRAPIGTKIYASANGVVRSTYNMDAVPGCKSYGQWILVDYNNGLTALYAHLSVRSVKAGESVQTGALLGLSGNTGYSTAAHLHMSIFPKDAVKVQQFSNSIGCKNAYVPIAALNAYLNPLDYF
ncbi:peptidoglycan DD-metalloendopeptidase family protein [Candidatus Nomurabacteria bacterium]|nr:peptidoglycan DD-metalloendopeptidase family protein [Candidatus Nomurabacteria bacterium]